MSPSRSSGQPQVVNLGVLDLDGIGLVSRRVPGALVEQDRVLTDVALNLDASGGAVLDVVHVPVVPVVVGAAGQRRGDRGRSVGGDRAAARRGRVR